MAQTSKRTKYEGDGASKLTQLIRNIGRNETSTIRLGTVKSAPPEIAIRLDGDDFDLDKKDLVIAQHLTAHERMANVTGAVINSAMSTQGYSPHTHDITSISLSDATISFTDELAPGERVLVECDDERMRYFVFDRAVIYE